MHTSTRALFSVHTTLSPFLNTIGKPGFLQGTVAQLPTEIVVPPFPAIRILGTKINIGEALLAMVHPPLFQWAPMAVDGKVGIGTHAADLKRTIKGNIHAEEVKANLSVPGPDYVFKEGYDLKTLEEVQNYIQEHVHLPNILFRKRDGGQRH